MSSNAWKDDECWDVCSYSCKLLTYICLAIMRFYILNNKKYINDDKDAFDEVVVTVGRSHVSRARIFSNGCLYNTWINEDSMNTVHPHHAHSFVAMVPHQPRARKKLGYRMWRYRSSSRHTCSPCWRFVQSKLAKIINCVRFNKPRNVCSTLMSPQQK